MASPSLADDRDASFPRVYQRAHRAERAADRTATRSAPARRTDDGGRPLDGATRARMERGLGHDFARVRIHADADAGARAGQLGAVAFTEGERVSFAPGAYQPGTTLGDALLAHELAHVIQQRGDGPPVAGAAHEAEADRAAGATLTGGRAALAPRGGRSLQLMRCGAPSWTKPIDGATAAEVERMLRRTPLIAPHVVPRLPATPVVGHMHVVDEDTFATQYAAYAAARPGTTTRAADVGGFRDGTELTLPDRSHLGDAVHEAIHLFSDAGFTGVVGHNANEGVTQFLTLEVLRANDIGRDDFRSYSGPQRAVAAMASGVGAGLIADAYFDGAVLPLIAAVGRDRWLAWTRHMRAAEYQQAAGLFW